jgi:hypothetical protein
MPTQLTVPGCSNDGFRNAVAHREQEDARLLQDKMKRPLEEAELSHCGVSQLRRFLEQLLQQRYLESVPAIVPLLEQEFRNTVRVGILCSLAG